MKSGNKIMNFLLACNCWVMVKEQTEEATNSAQLPSSSEGQQGRAGVQPWLPQLHLTLRHREQPSDLQHLWFYSHSFQPLLFIRGAEIPRALWLWFSAARVSTAPGLGNSLCHSESPSLPQEGAREGWGSVEVLSQPGWARLLPNCKVLSHGVLVPSPAWAE